MKKSHNKKIILERTDWQMETVLESGDWLIVERVSEIAVRVRKAWAWEGVCVRVAKRDCERVEKRERERVERMWWRSERESDREWRREAWEGEWVTESGEVCARVRGRQSLDLLYFWKNPIRNRVSKTQFLGGTHVDRHITYKSKTWYINRVL